MSKSDRDDWLLLLLGLPILLSTMLTPGGFEVDSGAFAIGAMETSGLIAMIYAAIKKMRRKIRHDGWKL